MKTIEEILELDDKRTHCLPDDRAKCIAIKEGMFTMRIDMCASQMDIIKGKYPNMYDAAFYAAAPDMKAIIKEQQSVIEDYENGLAEIALTKGQTLLGHLDASEEIQRVYEEGVNKGFEQNSEIAQAVLDKHKGGVMSKKLTEDEILMNEFVEDMGHGFGINTETTQEVLCAVIRTLMSEKEE